ncbi:MAG: hypothetical protein COB67_09535 [SAR324 cluster bacterium]|uniref:Uncharacterized protein n=1 Tax=SAR324 cluster bacterium TaxID=2024889 RepID=A0A2A4T1M7_9DELT|nr:MAG: hypothetical protein COB67_09535 [SAR324 cluster bacterium]
MRPVKSTALKLLVRIEGKKKHAVYFTNNVEIDAFDTLQGHMLRWSVEATFEEALVHLGVLINQLLDTT